VTAKWRDDRVPIRERIEPVLGLSRQFPQAGGQNALLRVVVRQVLVVACGLDLIAQKHNQAATSVQMAAEHGRFIVSEAAHVA
jgi:hypothetical protein